METNCQTQAEQYNLVPPANPDYKVIMKHNSISNRSLIHDANTLIECLPFSSIGKIQPFLVTMTTNVYLLIDFHSHLTMSQVSGYLAGHWDFNSHTLSITHAFPCRNLKADRDNAANVEKQIQESIEKQNLTLVGWYHSHPTMEATPTLRDIDNQLEYQIKLKGTTEANYTPCVGVICASYHIESSLESNIICYWVIPPSENKPNEYGRPMLMSCSIIQDATLDKPIMNEMKKCVEYYKNDTDYVKFNDKLVLSTQKTTNKRSNLNAKHLAGINATYFDKLKTSLISKLPKDMPDSKMWSFLKEILEFTADENVLLPPQEKLTSMNRKDDGKTISSSLSSNNLLMNNNDLANAIFQSNKFPASVLLGLSDPMARATLAANNMFLSPQSLFKMQDALNLLKPLSTSSPISSSLASGLASNLSATTNTTSNKLDLSSLKLPSDITVIKPSTSVTKSEYTPGSSLIDITVTPKSYKHHRSDYDLFKKDIKHSNEFNLAEFAAKNQKLLKDLGIADITGKMPKLTDFTVPDLSNKSMLKLSGDITISPHKSKKSNDSNSGSDLSITSLMAGSVKPPVQSSSKEYGSLTITPSSGSSSIFGQMLDMTSTTPTKLKDFKNKKDFDFNKINNKLTVLAKLENKDQKRDLDTTSSSQLSIDLSSPSKIPKIDSGLSRDVVSPVGSVKSSSSVVNNPTPPLPEKSTTPSSLSSGNSEQIHENKD